MGIFFPKIDSDTVKISFGSDKNLNRTSNIIKTTKYSLLSFLPKSLILQFTKPANFVYLISAILQSISIISSLSPITATAPLGFVLAVSLFRQAFQDYKRYKKDTQTNQKTSLKLFQGEFIEIKWEEIRSGDIIKIKNGQFIPADTLILYTSQQNSLCYVQTANLDGESNLKTKYAFVDGIKLYPNQFQSISGHMIVSQPSSQLYEFSGMICLDEHQPKHIEYQNLVLRQTVLKNTDEVVGVALFCGNQSKIMLNKGHIQHKVSKVQKKVNFIQIFLLLTLVGMCAFCSIGYYIYHSSIGRENLFYIKPPQVSLASQSVLIFFTSFLLLNFLIPISLNVLIEFSKAFLVLFMQYDQKFKKDHQSKGLNVLNMSIIQELGLVDYVLTDKTGTLTANEMVFKGICICDKVYQVKQIQQNLLTLTIKPEFHNFWIGLVLCHDVVKDFVRHEYQGSSPDEVCFINYAKTIGYQFIKRTKNYIQIQVQGKKVVYQLLHMIPFSPRKRMTVIVKDVCRNNEIIVFTKGADSAIFQKSAQIKDQKVFQVNINNFAKQGYRTLAFAYRTMSPEDFNQLLIDQKNLKQLKLQKLMSSEALEVRQNKIIQFVENKLNILGATAIQDKLQDDVPKTIQRLQQAGITVMMITGDKLQTAQNIGYLANFIKKGSKVYKIRSFQDNIPQLVQRIIQQILNYDQKVSVIIEGAAIRAIMFEEKPQVERLYIQLLKKCTSIIFCRSSPKEKAMIVKFVKNKLSGIVLAIGDGGNDIGMIQQANIGVGILGKEGNSAAAASDFSFQQFKYLDRLLFHHGRWIYQRLAYFFVYYGWKNLVITVLMFMYLMKCAYSGFPALSQLYITSFNMLIGMFLIGYYSVWAQDINDDFYPDIWRKLPELYKSSKKVDLFSYYRYLLWTLMGVSLAVALDIFIDLAFGGSDAILNQTGNPIDYNTLYAIKAITLSLIVVIVILIDMKSFTIFTMIISIFAFTILPMFFIFAMEEYIYFGIGYKAVGDNIGSLKFCLILILITFGTIAFKYGINMFYYQFSPSEVEKILIQKYGQDKLSPMIKISDISQCQRNSKMEKKVLQIQDLTGTEWVMMEHTRTFSTTK